MMPLYYIQEVLPNSLNRHNNNMLEPLQVPICSIVIRIRYASTENRLLFLELLAVRIFNDLHVTYVISSYEAAKGCRWQIHPDMPPVSVDRELPEAHSNFVARRKLTHIL